MIWRKSGGCSQIFEQGAPISSPDDFKKQCKNCLLASYPKSSRSQKYAVFCQHILHTFSNQIQGRADVMTQCSTQRANFLTLAFDRTKITFCLLESTKIYMIPGKFQTVRGIWQYSWQMNRTQAKVQNLSRKVHRKKNANMQYAKLEYCSRLSSKCT